MSASIFVWSNQMPIRMRQHTLLQITFVARALGRTGALLCDRWRGALVTRIEWNGNEMWHSSALLYTRGRLKGLCAQTLMQMCQFHTSYVSIKLYTLARTHIYFPSSSSIAPSQWKWFLFGGVLLFVVYPSHISHRTAPSPCELNSI